jgi:hypothetical protein
MFIIKIGLPGTSIVHTRIVELFYCFFVINLSSSFLKIFGSASFSRHDILEKIVSSGRNIIVDPNIFGQSSKLAVDAANRLFLA